jgi:hypothetical protein
MAAATCRIDFAAPRGHEFLREGPFPTMNKYPHV